MPSDARAARPFASPTGPPTLPPARGPLTHGLFRALQGKGAVPVPGPPPGSDALADEDLQLALYCCYELHYRGFAGVDGGLEWDPAVLALRAWLEAATEAALRAAVGPFPERGAGAEVVEELWALATGGGPSLSAWLLEHGTRAQAQELAVHRSAYQLKEADPHTWAIPRLAGEAKAAMVTIQHDEYGAGVAPAMHAALFADTMTALGLDAGYGAYLDRLPAATLATTNLISLLGLHRRLRGALVGHLALFEMTSVGPMSRYSAWMRRLGVGEEGRRFYDVHVEADEVHQHIAADRLVAGLLRAEPALAGDVVFGARALGVVEGHFSAMLRSAWDAGRSSLRTARGSGPAGRLQAVAAAA